MVSFREWSRLQRALLLIVVVAVMCIGLFAGAEAAVRIRHRIKFGQFWGIEETYKLDQVSGLRIPVPGGSFGPVHINSLGFRGPEIAFPKPASTLRIAFLGSSTTYCAEVSSNEASWPYLVTDAVRKHWPNIGVDYINAGVPGYSVKHSLLNLNFRVGRLQPDLIVIYEGHNDLSANSFDMAVNQGLASKRTEQELSWPSKYSLLWYLVEKNLIILRQERTAHNLEAKLKCNREALVAPFRNDLRELVQASQKVAKLVVLVTFSTQLRRGQTSEQQVRAAATSLYYMPYMSVDCLVESYEAYNDAVRQVAQETGALLVSDEYMIPGDDKNFVDSVHFNDEGSRKMAQRLIVPLLESDMVRKIASGKASARVSELQ